VPIICARHAIAFFPVPKNACTTGKELIHALEHGAFHGRRRVPGPPPRMESIHSLWGTAYLKAGDIEATAGMWRFAILRDPVARLVSAWKSKVVRQGALSIARAGAALAKEGLPPDPGFAAFVAALDGYRAASPVVAHHTDPQIRFLGRDPGVFHALYGMGEMARLRADLAARTGVALVLPPIANATGDLPAPAVDAALRQRIAAIYAEDLDTFGTVLARPGMG
jgi:hypothetical protein